jgi:hypothetical protein
MNKAVRQVFPDATDVFAAPADASPALLPLASIDLSQVNPEWTGTAHLVSPTFTDGHVGDGTEEFHTCTCRANWIGFRLDESNRYHFLADWSYFPDEPHDPSHFEHRRALHREHGALVETRWLDRQRLDDLLARPLAVVESVGGTTPGWPNWAETDFPLATDDEEDVHPLAEDGSRFHHVATTVGWHWHPEGADRIVLFYEPVSRTALLTFDWS